jgi:hypothetical protein
VRYLGIPHTIERFNVVGVASTNDDPFVPGGARMYFHRGEIVQGRVQY